MSARPGMRRKLTCGRRCGAGVAHVGVKPACDEVRKPLLVGSAGAAQVVSCALRRQPPEQHLRGAQWAQIGARHQQRGGCAGHWDAFLLSGVGCRFTTSPRIGAGLQRRVREHRR